MGIGATGCALRTAWVPRTTTPPIDPGGSDLLLPVLPEQRRKQRGINVERARQGFLELEKFVRVGARAASAPWTATTSILAAPSALSRTGCLGDALDRQPARDLRRHLQNREGREADVPVGWHIWHNNSFNPIYRAEQDLHELSKYSDFMKIVMYNNCGGERMALYADNIGSTLYGDLSKQGLLDFNYARDGFKERSYDQIPHTGLSADYVYRETKRALEGVAGTKTQIWPGIDIDIPTEANTASARRRASRMRCWRLSGRGARRAAFPQVFRDEACRSRRRRSGYSGTHVGRLTGRGRRAIAACALTGISPGSGFGDDFSVDADFVPDLREHTDSRLHRTA